MEFGLLGPLEVRREDQLVELTGTRQRALLAVLLLRAGQVVPSDRLLEDVWADEPPRAGATALRVRVSQLRRALGPDGGLIAPWANASYGKSASGGPRHSASACSNRAAAVSGSPRSSAWSPSRIRRSKSCGSPRASS